MSKITRILVTLVVATVVGSAGVAAAAAVTGGSSTPSTSSPTPGSGPKDGKHAHAGVRVLTRALGISARTIGVSRKDLVAQLRSGKSIAQVAQAHQVQPQTVVDALVKAATDRINAAEQAGKITAAQAATLEQKAKTRAEKFVNATHALRKVARAATAARKGLGLVAQTIGIDRSQLVSELRSGKTIADVARAHNVDPQKVVDALVKAATERINAAEQAGRINADRAKQLEETLNGRIEKLVNQWHPHRVNAAAPSPSA